MGDESPVSLKSPIPSWRASPPSLGARLGWLGLASAALDLTSVYWKTPAIRAGVTWGDVVDAATPVLLILLYGLVLRELSRTPSVSPPRRSDARPRLLFTLGGLGLLLGHGIHVAANSIHDAIDRAGITDPQGLANWWDERVSHMMVHGSKALICVGLTAIESRRVAGPRRPSSLLVAGALAYGFITFAEGIEGQTVALLLPFVLLYLAWSLGRGRPYAPVRLFYTLGAIVSILLFAYWGITHHGFPEFSQVGLIPGPR